MEAATEERSEGENFVRPGAGPPLHVHHHQAEGFTVREGRIGYQRQGEPERFAGPGETVVFGPGESHRFWNAGESDLRCDWYVEPADNGESLLTEIFESMRRRGGSQPDLFDLAFLMQRYRSEFTMLAIPALAQRLVAPLLVAVGTVLGKYPKYRDAPEPARC